jgi:hypothetical protein
MERIESVPVFRPSDGARLNPDGTDPPPQKICRLCKHAENAHEGDECYHCNCSGFRK